LIGLVEKLEKTCLFGGRAGVVVELVKTQSASGEELRRKRTLTILYNEEDMIIEWVCEV
jgi:hypothetical protein